MKLSQAAKQGSPRPTLILFVQLAPAERTSRFAESLSIIMGIFNLRKLGIVSNVRSLCNEIFQAAGAPTVSSSSNYLFLPHPPSSFYIIIEH